MSFDSDQIWNDDIDTDILLFGAKVCLMCGSKFPKSSEYFRRDADAPDGMKASCKECSR